MVVLARFVMIKVGQASFPQRRTLLSPGDVGMYKKKNFKFPPKLCFFGTAASQGQKASQWFTGYGLLKPSFERWSVKLCRSGHELMTNDLKLKIIDRDRRRIMVVLV